MRHETLSPTVQRLLDARQRIVMGWCQGTSTRSGDGQTEYCALAAAEPNWNLSVDMDIVNLLQRALPKGFRSVMVYNDSPMTTKEDIIALYDRAIELVLGNSRGNSIVDKLKELYHVS